MADRFPLVVDSSALQIKEIPSGDALNLAGNSIVGVVSITATGNVSIGGTLTYEDVNNVDSVGLITAQTGVRVPAGEIHVGSNIKLGNAGVVTASSFSGNFDASNLNTGTIPGARLPDPLPAIDGSALTGVISGVGIASGGTYIGSGATTINFVQSGLTATEPSAGVSTITIAAGGGGGSISTEALVSSGIVTTLNLTDAQDHKVTATGIVTVTCTGGAEGESHTVRIVNSGIATVGFSTNFLFPSGNAPLLPTADGAVSLISFTVHVGGNDAAGISTELLAGASLNFS